MSRKSKGLPPNVLDPDLQIQRLVNKVKECQETKFYGTVTLYVQAGNLLRWETKTTEVLSPQEEADGVTAEDGQPQGQQVQEEVSQPQQAGQAGP